ncbi:MAG TPA: acyl-CoA dehydrogenase family protein, partial [Thermoanaerobaculia bacterium]|nr:acyl-CoA dehydrogenase family protein [Thermoanaerobaculia bacterium]
MDFSLDPQLIALRDRVAAFVRDEVIPAEGKVGQSITDEVVADLRAKARAAGIYGPQLPPDYGGMGLGTVAMCVLFEQAGRSFLGPLAMHCSAPDEGNMHLLSLFANEEQKAQYLAPLVSGDI